MTFSMLITVFPLWMPATCSCRLPQGIEDGYRGVSYVRVYNACVGEVLGRFARDNEQWRALKARGG